MPQASILLALLLTPLAYSVTLTIGQGHIADSKVYLETYGIQKQDDGAFFSIRTVYRDGTYSTTAAVIYCNRAPNIINWHIGSVYDALGGVRGRVEVASTSPHIPPPDSWYFPVASFVCNYVINGEAAALADFRAASGAKAIDPPVSGGGSPAAVSPAGRTSASNPSEVVGPKRKSSGSGFVVSRDGYIVTNAHVIEKCGGTKVRIENHTFESTVRVADEKADLALIQVNRQFAASLPVRQTPISLGEDVTVFGYPLSGLLSPNLSLTRGVVSSVSGLRGDSSQYQISAPVQPGNSGGPIVDSSGNVIGVVVATLDALKLAQITGSIPQNINFGIRAEALRLFLEANLVKYGTSTATAPKSTADIARALASSIALVECY